MNKENSKWVKKENDWPEVKAEAKKSANNNIKKYTNEISSFSSKQPVSVLT